MLRNKVLSRTFPDGNDPYQMLSRLLEEAGELAAQVHHFEGAAYRLLLKSLQFMIDSTRFIRFLILTERLNAWK